MNTELLVSLIPYLLTGAAGVLVGAARVGRKAEAVERDIAEVRVMAVASSARIDAHDPRLAALEMARAVSDERWGHLVEAIDEIRRDLKELKGR